MSKRLKTAAATRLTPLARRIMELVEIVGDGSQRGFATKVGCSQALISKIATGQQQPGRGLIKNVLKLKNVEEDWLLRGTGQPPQLEFDDDFHVPIAEALVPGLPTAHRPLLTSRYEPVPRSLYGEDVYAVAAGCCPPAISDSDERLFPDDRIIVDASPHRWRDNLQILDGKLCAVRLDDLDGPVVTLRRVWYPSDPTSGKRSLVTVMDNTLASYREMKHQMKEEWNRERKFVRDIELRPADQIPASSDFRDEIPTSAIVGLALLVVRSF